jgi:TctA family transporter
MRVSMLGLVKRCLSCCGDSFVVAVMHVGWVLIANALVVVLLVILMWVILSRTTSGNVVFESFEQSVEDLLTSHLSLFLGIVTLLSQSRPKLDGGNKECAGFAD